jgi:hypothetical protein
MPNFDQSTWLAYRVQTAQEMGPPKLPELVALPGAKAAVPHAHLLAHQEAGRLEQDVIKRVNAKWREANAASLEEHDRWVAGPYAGAIAEMRKREMATAAEQLRKQALFEEILKEREA